MKLSREDAKKQLRRLAANAMLFPQTRDGQNEVLECLQRHCKDAGHAERAMTRLLDTCTGPRSLTAELASAAASTRQGEQAPAGCDQCTLDPDITTGEPRYMEFVYMERKDGISYAVRCPGEAGKPCARGQWLAAKDWERAGKAGPAKRPAQTETRDFAKLAAGDAE